MMTRFIDQCTRLRYAAVALPVLILFQVLFLAVEADSLPGPQAVPAPVARPTIHASDQALLSRALEAIAGKRYDKGRKLLEKLAVSASPLVPLAKLIIADAYYLQGGWRNVAEAEDQYAKWLDLYPEDKLAPRLMLQLADISLRVPLRDGDRAYAAERMLQKLQKAFPDFRPSEVQESLDIAQEILADHELRVARFYLQNRESPTAVERRSREIVDKWPRFSLMDEALWHLAVVEEAEGEVDQAVALYQRIVREHPASPYSAASENRLRSLGSAIPESDPSIGAERLDRDRRIAIAVAEVRAGSWGIPSRGVVLDESDRADLEIIQDFLNRQ